MNIFKKWFCTHKWKTHSKKEDAYSLNGGTYLYTAEILICECCGKIKLIEY